MKIVVIGAGYVGLVAGTCFAETGNQVICVDADDSKVRRLRQGEIPIFEPGLAEMVQRNLAAGRLSFETSTAEVVPGAAIVFLAIGTPQGDDGSADLTYLWQAVGQLSACIEPQTLVVIKSTVPVGTNDAVAARLAQLVRARSGGADRADAATPQVASNPEFLREGAAVADFMRPDRVVAGVRSESAAELLRELYRPFLRSEQPLLVMSPTSAEMTKYVANSLLALKISFINEAANLCQALGADVDDVRRGIGYDQRIGFAFLFPGLGYGGSCFPKDVRALQATARTAGVATPLLAAIDDVNRRQKTILVQTLLDELGDDLRGRRIALWGLAFKPRTDDIREAPALEICRQLLDRGAEVRVHDPAAMPNVQRLLGDALWYATPPASMYDASNDADALMICTEWKEYQHPDFARLRQTMRRPLILDGRNIYALAQMQAAGFTYYSIGRPTIRQAATPAATHD